MRSKQISVTITSSALTKEHVSLSLQSFILKLDNLERLADHAVNLADAVVQNTVSQQE